MLISTLTFGARFPVPVLPRSGKHAAYRPSWFVHEAHGDLNVSKLYQLLQDLNPVRAARLTDRRFRTIYYAVLDDMRERFPLDGWVSSREYLSEISEDELPFAAAGIPIAVHGVDMYEEQLLACLVIPFLLRQVRGDDMDDSANEVWAYQDALDPHRNWLLPYLTKEPRNQFRIPHLPRGREWLPPWDGLGELVLYAHGETGYRWLDYSTTMLLESAELPPLNLAEIRDLERDWRVAKPAFDRIAGLVRYLEKGPLPRRRKQLECMVRALLGDKPALMEFTRKKGTHAQAV